MLVGALAVSAALLAILAGLLFVPLELVFAVHRRESFGGSLAVTWLFGSVRIPLRRGVKKVKPPPPERSKRKARRFPVRRIVRPLLERRFMERLAKFGWQAVRAIRIRHLRTNAIVGTGDPADTGILWAWLAPFVVALQSNGHRPLDIGLDFESSRFEFDSAGAIRIVPAQLALLASMFLLSPATLHAGWRMAFPNA